MVDVDRNLDTEVTEGEDVTTVTGTSEHPPKPLPEIRPTPATAIEINVETGELHAPIGTIEHLADSVLALAKAFGGLSVASAEFATRDPDLPITVAAREGGPVVLDIGGRQFALPL